MDKSTEKKVDNYFAEKAKELNDTGVVVLKHDWLVDNLKKLQKRFMSTIRNFPEYNRHPDNKDKALDGTTIKYALGGFGALGNPASFHNHFVRQLRQWCMTLVVPMFSEFCKLRKHNYKLEQIIDRMMYRLAGDKPTPEFWHRDEAITDKEDLTFGGWINLDDKPQYLSCYKNTHQESGKSGFVQVTEKELKKIRKKRKEKGLPEKDKVKIPPGHLMIFFENTVHEVMSKELSYNSKRIFLGWRLTDSDKPILPEIEDILENQDVMYLKSGQGSAMFSPMHPNMRSRHKKPYKLDYWSENTFKPELLEEVTVKSGVHKGEKYLRVITELKKHKKASKQTKKVYQMPSLSELGLPMYRDYTETEKSILYPNRKWKGLLKIGSKTDVVDLEM